jgi:cobalt-zinc-cadmium efflux system outer membrane protein
VVCEEIAVAEQQLAAQQQRVLTDVRLGYYAVLAARRRLRVAEQWARIAEEGLNTVESMLRATEVSRMDVLRARIDHRRARLVLDNAGSEERATWTQLAAVLGTPEMQPAELTESPAESPALIEPEAALAHILEANPAVAALLSDLERARRSVDLAHSESVPDVEFRAILQSDNGTGSSNMNLVVSMPLPLVDRNQGRIQQAHAEAVAAEHAIARAELAVRRKLADILNRYAQAQDELKTYAGNGGVLENLRETLELVRSAYSAGELGYLDLISAEKDLVEAQFSQLDALAKVQSAVVQVEGLLLQDSLGVEGALRD